ncbi:hypothetical protein H4R19_004254, partial [Coemansia spiralis]
SRSTLGPTSSSPRPLPGTTAHPSAPSRTSSLPLPSPPPTSPMATPSFPPMIPMATPSLPSTPSLQLMSSMMRRWSLKLHRQLPSLLILPTLLRCQPRLRPVLQLHQQQNPASRRRCLPRRVAIQPRQQSQQQSQLRSQQLSQHQSQQRSQQRSQHQSQQLSQQPASR